MVVRLEEIREVRRVEERDRALVCDVHGVACFKPEKKAKWKHVNTCSYCFKWQVPSQESASGWELKAARVTTWPFIQHSWTPMTGLNALLWLFPDREYWRCSSALLCVYGCYYNTGTTHKSPTLNEPRGFCDSSWTALTMKTNTTETATNVQTDSTCTHVLTRSYTHTHTHGIIRTQTRVYTHILRYNFCS